MTDPLDAVNDEELTPAERRRIVLRAEAAARRRELTGYVILGLIILLVAFIVFLGAWGSARRQADLLAINCSNARSHHELAALTNSIARDLGLPTADLPFQQVPPECDGV